MIDLARLAPHLQHKLHEATAAERFRFFAMLLHGARYEVGRENIFATDCSGTICWPLYCLGLNIRLRAAELFECIYTRHVDIALIRDYWEHTYAVFYELAGTISHVTPVVGRGVILDAVNTEQPVQLKALEPVYNWYRERGYGFHFREIDWSLAQEVSDSGALRWEAEADEMLKEILLGGVV